MLTGETLKSYKARAEKENKVKTKVTKSQHKLWWLNLEIYLFK